MKFSHSYGAFVFLSLGISILIVIQSLIATKSFLALARWNSWKSSSKLVLFETSYVFRIDFLYYGVIFVLAPASYSGFNQFWFCTIGYLIIKNMLIIPVVTPISEFVSWLWHAKFKQAYD